MTERADRIADGRALGAAKRGEGLLLGSAAVAPLALAAGAVWLTPPMIAEQLSIAAIGWSGALLAFLAGVRRGLTFSEAGGAAWREIATMLFVFAPGVATLWRHAGAAAIGLAMLGFIAVIAFDVRAARRLQAPPYFRLFRPLQMAAALAALAVLLAKEAVGAG
jgi:hypothetical protein